MLPTIDLSFSEICEKLSLLLLQRRILRRTVRVCIWCQLPDETIRWKFSDYTDKREWSELGYPRRRFGYTCIRETIRMQICADSLSVVGLKNLTQTRNLINITTMTFALNWVVTDVSCGLAYTHVLGFFKLGPHSALEAEDKIEIGEVEVYLNIYLFPFISVSLAISIYSKISLHI